MKLKNFEFDLVDYGIASRLSGNRILLNRNLLKVEYDPLCREIIEHETRHTKKGYSWKDLKMDFQGFKNRKLYWLFVRYNPKSLYQFLPFIVHEKSFIIDLPILIAWSIFIIWMILLILLV